MNQWHNIHITDKTGREFFCCNASPDMYKFLDVAAAMIMLDGLPYGEPCEIDADQLLAELGL